MEKIDYINISQEKFKELGLAFEDLFHQEPIKVNAFISQGQMALKHFYMVLVGENANIWKLELSWSFQKNRLLIDDEYRGFSAEIKNSRVITEPYSFHKGRFSQDITIGYESSEHKKLLKQAFANQNKTIQDFVSEIAAVFFMLNILITHLPQKFKEKTEKDTMTVEEKKKGQKKYRSVVYLKHSYIVDSDFKLTKRETKYIIKCPAWGVRGHYRHLKSGQVIFIKPYTKGKERKNLDKYVSKEYKLC